MALSWRPLAAAAAGPGAGMGRNIMGAKAAKQSRRQWLAGAELTRRVATGALHLRHC